MTLSASQVGENELIEIRLGLSEMHLILDAKSRLNGIISASSRIVKENDHKNDIWSIREIGSYALGFLSMMDEIMASRSGVVASDVLTVDRAEFISIVDRAEIFCGIAERACRC